jgi:hypothetical protein
MHLTSEQIVPGSASINTAYWPHPRRPSHGLDDKITSLRPHEGARRTGKLLVDAKRFGKDEARAKEIFAQREKYWADAGISMAD